MTTATHEIALAPDLESLLAGLRWRIRLYIWAEGLALAVVWLGLIFWVGFGLDYLPVMLGASEMPAGPRCRERRAPTPRGRHSRTLDTTVRRRLPSAVRPPIPAASTVDTDTQEACS